MPTDNTIEMGLLERRDLESAVELLGRVFRNPPDRCLWEWYIYGCPHGASRVYVLRSVAGRLAAIFGFQPCPLIIDGRNVNASFAHHLAVDPDAREEGLFMQISVYALRREQELGAAFVFGPPNRHGAVAHKMLMGWKDYFWLECLCMTQPAAAVHQCEILDGLGDEFEMLYARITKSVSFCRHKTARWMNWRFRDRPGRAYTMFGYFAGGELAAVVVLKRWTEANGYQKVHIMDLLAVDEIALAEVLKAAKSFAAGRDELNLWCAPGYPYRSLLLERGFRAKTESAQLVIAKALQDSVVTFPRGPGIFVYGDADGY